MPDPTSDDDGWGDLYAELGLDKPAAATPAPAEVPPPHTGPAEYEGWPADEGAEAPHAADPIAVAEAAFDEGGEGDDEGDEDEGGEGTGVTGEGQPGEDQPGTGRKRRRRRRRKKGKGPEGAGGEPAAEGEAAPEPDAEPASYGAMARHRPEPRASAPRPPAPRHVEPDADEFEGSDDADEPTGLAPAADEDTGTDMLRDLIATWNVPSWDDIIAGLHR